MALADWTDENPRRGTRLLKSAGNRFAFQEWPDSSPLESRTLVRPDIWYHIAVTQTGQNLTSMSTESPNPMAHRLRHSTSNRNHGCSSARAVQDSLRSTGLDEIAFYNRALTAKEAKICINCASAALVSRKYSRIITGLRPTVPLPGLESAEIPSYLATDAKLPGNMSAPGGFRLSVSPSLLDQAREVLDTRISDEELAAQAEAAGEIDPAEDEPPEE